MTIVSSPMGREGGKEPRLRDKAAKLAGRLQDWTERYHQHGPLFRLLWVIVGALITLAGLVMLVLPGPALAVLPVGLAMLSLEFSSARRVLQSVLAKASGQQPESEAEGKDSP